MLDKAAGLRDDNVLEAMMEETLSVKTRARNEMVDITSEVCAFLQNSGCAQGLCVIYCPHTTGAITINENADPDVAQDLDEFLCKIVPASWKYRHAEGNSDSHLKSTLVGCSETVIVEDGKPLLGTWQGIYFCEFDGPRHRKVILRAYPKVQSQETGP